MRCLQTYGWPGNIRELENAIERAVALERSTAIRLTSLPEHVQNGIAPGAAAGRDAGLPDSGFDLEQHVQDIEREYLGRSAAPGQRRQEPGGRAAGHQLPAVPVSLEEVQPEIGPGPGGLGPAAGVGASGSRPDTLRHTRLTIFVDQARITRPLPDQGPAL